MTAATVSKNIAEGKAESLPLGAVNCCPVEL